VNASGFLTNIIIFKKGFHHKKRVGPTRNTLWCEKVGQMHGTNTPVENGQSRCGIFFGSVEIWPHISINTYFLRYFLSKVSPVWPYGWSQVHVEWAIFDLTMETSSPRKKICPPLDWLANGEIYSPKYLFHNWYKEWAILNENSSRNEWKWEKT
jgi:hypothetical protein